MFKESELRQRISIERVTETPDDQGGFTRAWNNLQDCWAKIENASASERVYAQKLEDIYTHKIIIRNTQDYAIMTAKDRIVFGTRIFEIKTVNFINEEKWFIKIMAAENEAS